MAAVDNHYEFLGLEPSASQAEIEAAIEEVSEQAITLVYSSPQRSADLWERIRRMRRDLLATPEGRQVYDEALRRSENGIGGESMAPAELLPVFRQPEARVPFDAPSAEAISGLAVVPPVKDEEESRGVAWPYALIAAAAVLVAVAAALVAREPGVTPARRPVAMSLSQLGAVRDSKFVSGSSITLAWTRIPHASLYHLQIATSRGGPLDAAIFAHGSRTISLTTSTYRLRVTGSQLYYWRVQARVGNAWQRYTALQHFAVAKPSVTKPVALAPVSGIAKGGKHARLCWSAVAHAVGYRLRVQGQKIRTVSGTCVTLSVKPQTYRWSVAALVKGVAVYTGAYSVAEVLHIRPARPSTRTPHSMHHPIHHVTNPHPAAKRNSKSGRHSSVGGAPVQVEVAAAIPTPRLSTTGPTGSALRPAIASVQRRATVASDPKKTARPSRFYIRPVQASAAGPRHATTVAANTGASGYVPRRPGTPVKRHTPVTSSTAGPAHSSTPAPPAPPSVAVGSAPTVPAVSPTQTRVVVTAKSPTPSAGIIVRPIVAAQIPARTQASPTSTRPAANSAGSVPVTYPIHQTSVPSTPPVVHATNPVPTSTRATIPTPTPVQGTPHGPSDDGKHPEHPEHPVHPTHPEHPTHP